MPGCNSQPNNGLTRTKPNYRFAVRPLLRLSHLPGVMATALGLVFSGTVLDPAWAGEPGSVKIHSDFPGGNVVVAENAGSAVQVAPDLRGDNPWFYWYFEARAVKPGRVDFVFPEKVAGFKDGAIGYQGPAISEDGGRTWQWMGTENVDGSRFYFDFSQVGQRIRFAVTIPYVQSNLDGFLEQYAANPHLKSSVLTESRHGRDVELLQIGKPRSGVKAVLVTARHHAAETMASYVLEGFLQEALSDNTAGEQFRAGYVLYVVPFVDKDGVEEGDQGKNRKPYDHNRDYGPRSIYPEVQAIKDLERQVGFRFALDLHCPTLVMEDHQVAYFVGAKERPPYNHENVSEFAAWIKKGVPEKAPYGPLVWLKNETKPSPKSSRYFGFREDMIMSVTFEFPFAPPGKSTDPGSCREYGRAMLRAWGASRFHAPYADAQ